jgi:hypothetical protein
VPRKLSSKDKQIPWPSHYEPMIRPDKWPRWEKPDAAAMRALFNGVATSEQQKRAVDWIIYASSQAYGNPYREFSDRATYMFMGRMGVGQDMIYLAKLAATILDVDRMALYQSAVNGEETQNEP